MVDEGTGQDMHVATDVFTFMRLLSQNFSSKFQARVPPGAQVGGILRKSGAR